MRRAVPGFLSSATNRSALQRHRVTYRTAMQIPSAATARSTDPARVEEATKLLVKEACAPRRHRVRKFDYQSDLQDLRDICANVYGGTDYMPRIIHRIAKDPGVLVLAAEAILPGDAEQQPDEAAEPGQQQEQQQSEGKDPQTGSSRSSIIDGIICGERRGDVVWLYGLRVREGTRGRGLGHQLMEAIVQMAPQLLATAPEAHPPPPRSSTQPSHAASTHLLHPQLPPSDTLAALSPFTASTPVAAMTPRSAASAVATGPIRQIVTCTVTYNQAAQRIIGRQLSGPLYEVEIWPGPPLLEEYEAAAGWVRGVGLKPGAPSMVDWLPNVREALAADVAAQVLLPHWRRVTSDCELRAAVAHLLYGSSSSGTCALVTGGGAGSGTAAGADGLGKGGQDGAPDVGPTTMAKSSSARPSTPESHPAQPDTDCLWLPMPYDLWPLEGAFIQRELAAGNIWLLAQPAAEGSHFPRVQEDPVAKGNLHMGAGKEAVNMEGAIVGVMVLTHYETLSRVCAGILARNNAVVHAAIAHAGRLQPHFMASALRVPAGCKRSVVGLISGRPNTGVTEGTDRRAKEEPEEYLPAVYAISGGHRGVLMYGHSVMLQTRH